MGGWTIVWTNSALLVGALGLAVPWLVHLLTRRTPRMLVFPTVQFLKRAKAGQSAFFRLRDGILLLLRTVFVLLLLLAFLKPVLRASALVGDETNRQAAIVIVDTSLSMRYNTGMPFARAQFAAEKVLDHFTADDIANVIFADASPSASLETLSASAAALKRDVSQASPTIERADIDAALVEAVRQLQEFPDRARYIYLVSDFQRSNWSAAKFSSVPNDIKLVFVPAGDRNAANVAITDVSIRPRMPVLSEMIDIVCTVSNFGGAATNVPVTLGLRAISQEDTGVSDTTEKSIALAPGTSGTAEFRFRAARTGSFEGTVRIPGDALRADDARFFVLTVRDRIDVLLVSDVAAEGRSSAHFMWRALDPYASDGRHENEHHASPVRVRVIRAKDLDLESALPQVLILDGAGQLPGKNVEQIVQFATNGGAVIYMLSDALDKGNIDAITSKANVNWVSPFSIAAMVDRERLNGAPGKLSDIKLDDAIFRRFKDTGDISGLTFDRYFTTRRQEGRGEVLARYDDGNFAMGKATLGSGLVLLCNFSAGRDASSLAQSPAFIPLVHEMVKSVRPRKGVAARAIVGYPVSGSAGLPASSSGLAVLSPSGNSINAFTERRGQELGVMLPAAQECGFFRITEGSSQIGCIPVNIDARESDLMPLTEAQLNDLAASPDRAIASSSVSGTRAIGTLLEGVPIWPYLLFAALCVMGMEQVALGVLKR